MALIAGCNKPTPQRLHAPGQPVLRAIYRDATHHLLVVVRNAVPTDCTAPLLIDDATGAVHRITRDAADNWISRMQLAGAVEGTCPET